MENVLTISQLLTQAKCEYMVYDLGRKVTQVENKQFAAIEENKVAYPYPIKRHAQFGITFWQEGLDPWIWFLQFPLDERGLLNQALVGDFIKYVATAMGSDFSLEQNDELKQKLAENPYTFKPQDDKLAVFHSLVQRNLNLNYSNFYTQARTYLSGDLGWNNWQNIGLQGIADLVVNLDKDNNLVILKKSLLNLPQQPLYAVLGALEHLELPAAIANRLYELYLAKNEQDLFLATAVMRSLAGAPTIQLETIVTETLKNNSLNHREMFIAIAGRCWNGLTNQEVLRLFLLKLAQLGDQSLFNQLFIDLVMLPNLRHLVLSLLNNKSDPQLDLAIANLQQVTRH